MKIRHPMTLCHSAAAALAAVAAAAFCYRIFSKVSVTDLFYTTQEASWMWDFNPRTTIWFHLYHELRSNVHF